MENFDYTHMKKLIQSPFHLCVLGIEDPKSSRANKMSLSDTRSVARYVCILEAKNFDIDSRTVTRYFSSIALLCSRITLRLGVMYCRHACEYDGLYYLLVRKIRAEM